VHKGGLDDWGLQERIIGGEGGGSYRWEAPIKSEADLESLHFPTIQVDYETTQRLVALAEATLGIWPAASELTGGGRWE
jgi:hypothetical protein